MRLRTVQYSMDNSEKGGPASRADVVHMKSQECVVFKQKPVLYSINLYQTKLAVFIMPIVNCSLIFFV